jgi:hypothetical protein
MDGEGTTARIAVVVEFASIVFKKTTANLVEVAGFVSMGEKNGSAKNVVVPVFVIIIMTYEVVPLVRNRYVRNI